MSTMMNMKKECAICGHVHEYTVVTSTNAFGYSDLDSRPPEMMRSTMLYNVMVCPKCHYANYDITKKIYKMDEEWLKDEEYLAIVKDKKISKFGKAFMLCAHLQYKAGHKNEAAYDYLSASWMLEDDRYLSMAKVARKLACSIFKEGFKNQKDLTTRMICVDLMRRNGEFDDSLNLANEVLKKNPSDDFIKILKYQIALCEYKDSTVYTFEDAIRYSKLNLPN